MPQVACTTLENVDVECTHCGVRMSTSTGGGGTIRYYRCPSCSRFCSSMYSEVLRADSKMRARKPEPEVKAAGFGTVKERLDAWLRAISIDDPYRQLGVSPDMSDGSIREKYLALARVHHPDRGGNAEEMRRINAAYEKVLAHREQHRVMNRSTALAAGH